MQPKYFSAMHRLGLSPDAIERVLDDVAFGLFVDHPEDGCIYASAEVLRMFEIPWEEFAGFGWANSVLPADMEVMREAIERYEVARSTIDVRYRIRVPDGRIKALHVIGHAVLNEQGEQVGSVMIGRDVTAERELADRTLQAQKLEAIGRLSGRIAHDFNNVLTPILCAASMLEMEGHQSDQGRECLNLIVQGVHHAAGITRQLLSLSRRGDSAHRTVQLDQEIRNLQPMLRQLVGERIELLFEPDAKGIQVGLGEHELGQIVLNLCINARDAMEGCGVIRVRTRRDGGTCLLEVSDTGPGIAVHVQQRMFEPFFTTKPADRGTGLGLSTVLELVNRACGEISVHSELGSDTRLTIRLPILDIAIHAPKRRVADVQVAPMRVLLVDDNSALRQTLAYVLALRGHKVRSASSVDGAKARLAEEQFDLLVTDLLLPDGRGDDLVLEARAEQPSLLVVLMSGNFGPFSEASVEGAPSTVFLQKPFHPNRLAAALAEVQTAKRQAV